MTLNLDIETRFKVTSYFLPESTLWVKYEQYWAKGREDMFQKSDLGRTDRRMDGCTGGRTD